MNIILIEDEELQGTRFVCTDRRAEHIVKVLRAGAGDRVRVGLINGLMGTGRIAAIKTSYPFSVELHIDLEEVPPLKPSIDLILALPRPIMLKRILSQVTALGVGVVHLVNARRVEKSFWEAGLLSPDEYRFHLLYGLEQAVDTRLPEIRIHRKFKPFIEDYFPAEAANYDLLLLGDPRGRKRLSEVVCPAQGRVAVAVGPEGGWVDYEREKFEELHFVACTMGERILKVDTAVIALHASVSIILDQAKFTKASERRQSP
ncbi:MAG: 16S rRNA (uracil(1498)-N(3))-methyltransferase [Desulforhopalus sp.]